MVGRGESAAPGPFLWYMVSVAHGTMWARMRGCLVAFAVLAGVLWGRAAQAGAPGTIVVTAAPVDPNGPSFEKDLKKAKRSAIGRTDGKWHLYFIAYFKKAPGTSELLMVFYDPASSKVPVNTYPFSAKADAKGVMSDIEIAPEGGFKPGRKYELRIIRLIHGREEVFARTMVVLK